MMWDPLIQLVIHRGVQMPSLVPRRDSQPVSQFFLYFILLSQLLRSSVTRCPLWRHETLSRRNGRSAAIMVRVRAAPLLADLSANGAPLRKWQESCRAATETFSFSS